jgi:hypothetical protein
MSDTSTLVTGWEGAVDRSIEFFMAITNAWRGDGHRCCNAEIVKALGKLPIDVQQRWRSLGA